MFTALDPFEGSASRPMSLNGYLYVEGDPVNNVDPSGMFTVHTLHQIASVMNSSTCIQNPEVDEGFCDDSVPIELRILFGCLNLGVPRHPDEPVGGQCGIDVASIWAPSAAAGTRHLFIIFIDENRQEFEYRAGPGAEGPNQQILPGCEDDDSLTRLFGSMCASTLPYISGVGIDASRSTRAWGFVREPVMRSHSVCDKRECLDRMVQVFNDADHEYHPLPNSIDGAGKVNSNTFVRHLMEVCDIPIQPVPEDGVFPGFNILIPRYLQ